MLATKKFIRMPDLNPLGFIIRKHFIFITKISSKYSGWKTDHKGLKPECETKSSRNAKKKKRNENVEDSIRAAVKKEVKEKMRELSLDTGSRLKKIERQSFQDKEEMKQMKIKYDREIAKLTREKIRLELKLSARMQCSEEYHSTGTGANNAQMPDLN